MSTDLGKILFAAVVTAVVGLLVTESYQSTPWLADKFMRWSVRLRYPDNLERATVRGEELISLLADLPTLFKFPTAAGFLLRALASRAAHRRKQARREPRPVQHSRGASFRIALTKAVWVILCTGTVFGFELAIALRSVNILMLGLYGLAAGIVTAGEVVARPSRFHPGFVGGTMCTVFIFAPFSIFEDAGTIRILAPTALFGGAAFGLAATLVGALTGRSEHIGIVIGTLTNIIGIELAMFPTLYPPAPFFWFIGFGLAVGPMAGFIAAVGCRTPGKTPREIGARSSAGARE